MAAYFLVKIWIVAFLLFILFKSFYLLPTFKVFNLFLDIIVTFDQSIMLTSNYTRKEVIT